MTTKKSTTTPARRRQLAINRIITNIRQLSELEPSEELAELIEQHTRLLATMYRHHVEACKAEAEAENSAAIAEPIAEPITATKQSPENEVTAEIISDSDHDLDEEPLPDYPTGIPEIDAPPVGYIHHGAKLSNFCNEPRRHSEMAPYGKYGNLPRW